MRNLRIMGLAVIAMMAMSAMVASAASAAPDYRSETAGPATTYLTGTSENTHEFKAGTVPVKCTHTSGKGTFVSPTTALTTTEIVYTGCTVAGQTASVNMNGCDYNFGAATGASSPYLVTNITIECPAGKDIIITATTAGCTITVEPQVTDGTTTAANVAGPPKTVTLNVNITKIKYTPSGGICGTPAGVTKSDGTYTGQLLVKGYSDAAHTKTTGIFIE